MASRRPRETAPVDPAPSTVMGLLHEHVPLALLLDVAEPAGPSSEEILESEGRPVDRWWEPETP